ncbi:MAG: methyltransferase domain-containing protein [Chthoniobacteraceae bacterium]
MKTPVAVFAYRRPRHLEQTLAALAKCHRLDECEVIIFCDGGDDVEATRQVARAWAARHSARVVEREKNHGLARSIVGEVSTLCASHGRVIVLEDDLVVAPDFLRFMLDALDRYADCTDVLQVSGYMFPVEHTTDAFFLPLTTTWGWATWARAWERFAWEPSVALRDPATRSRFNLDDSYDYARLLEERLRGGNDSWGVLWQWALFASGGLALHPRSSLVRNIGFDGSGTHGDTQDPWGAAPPWRLPASLRWPEPAEDDAAFDRIKEFLRQRRATTARWSPTDMLSTLLKKARDVIAPGKPGRLLDDKTPDTGIYWDPAMAAALETWGEGNTWDEIQYLLVGAKGRVLDIACGTGKTMELLAKFAPIELHGCDISDFLLKKAVERGIAQDRLVECDATKMPYPDGAFDYSYSIGSLEHFTEEGISACAGEAARLTRVFSAHMVPVSRSGRDEGWMKTIQSFHNMSVAWWEAKFRAAFPVVHVLDSRWNDAISVGKWFVCCKS